MKKLYLFNAVLILLASTLPTWSTAEDIYKWVDKHGNVHYGEQPNQSNYQKVKPEALVTTSFTPVQKIEFSQPPIDIERKPPLPKKGQVWLFTTPSCRACGKAKDYFKSNNITYKELDIKANKKNYSLFKSHDGRGVPLTLIGNYKSANKIHGFTPAKFDAAFKK